jgi:hypothetical protein
MREVSEDLNDSIFLMKAFWCMGKTLQEICEYKQAIVVFNRML